MLEDILYLTELQELKVLDLERRTISRVRDVVLVPSLHPVRVDRFLIGEGSTLFSIRYDQVASIDLDGLCLRDERLVPSREPENVWRLGRDLLDQQIVDVGGRKVVRVSDVTFRIHHENGYDALHILEVDIGMRSILRRVFQGILPPRLIRRLQEPIAPKSISWEHCNIIEPDPLRRLRLNTSYHRLEKIHPADLADIVEELPPAQREAILETIDSGVAADALGEIEPEMRANILESLEPERAAEIVEEMAPDEAADTLAELEEKTSEEILAEMEHEPKTEVEQLLEYPADTAGGLMTTRFIAVSEEATVREAVEKIRENEDLVELLTNVFLVGANEELQGAVSSKRLLLAAAETQLKDIKLETSFQIPADESQDRVLELFDKYNLMTLAVVDDSKRLLGVITADDIITVLRQS